MLVKSLCFRVKTRSTLSTGGLLHRIKKWNVIRAIECDRTAEFSVERVLLTISYPDKRRKVTVKDVGIFSIKSLRGFCCADTMDKTEIKENEWTACHLQGMMMHSHGRCIKVVYAREEDHPLSRLASLSL